MPWPKTGLTRCHVQLGSPDKGQWVGCLPYSMARIYDKWHGQAQYIHSDTYHK